MTYRVLLVPGHAANVPPSGEHTAEGPEALHGGGRRAAPLLSRDARCLSLRLTVRVWATHSTTHGHMEVFTQYNTWRHGGFHTVQHMETWRFSHSTTHGGFLAWN